MCVLRLSTPAGGTLHAASLTEKSEDLPVDVGGTLNEHEVAGALEEAQLSAPGMACARARALAGGI
jgi:hypothetical protein